MMECVRKIQYSEKHNIFPLVFIQMNYSEGLLVDQNILVQLITHTIDWTGFIHELIKDGSYKPINLYMLCAYKVYKIGQIFLLFRIYLFISAQSSIRSILN